MTRRNRRRTRPVATPARTIMAGLMPVAIIDREATIRIAFASRCARATLAPHDLYRIHAGDANP